MAGKTAQIVNTDAVHTCLHCRQAGSIDCKKVGKERNTQRWFSL